MPGTLRVGFIMGGGVSLGAFSGGALGETLRLLQDHLDRDKYDQCVVDVFSGASAGAMSLVGTVRAMSRGGDPLETMRQVWVEAIDLGGGSYLKQATDRLLPAAFSPRSASLLNPDAVPGIGAMMFARSPGDAADGRPHALLGDEVLMSVSLSNLNGYTVDARGELMSAPSRSGDVTGGAAELLQTTFFADRRRFHYLLDDALTPETEGEIRTARRGDDADGLGAFWDEAMAASLASGAFPLAFLPQPLTRDRREYGPILDYAAGPIDFVYSDGGVFNNEPIGEAVQLANMIDPGQPEETHRLFIYIDPHISGPRHDESCWKGKNKQEGLKGMYAIALRLFTAIRGESTAKDWLRAAKYNSRVQWSEHVDEMIAGLINEASDAASATAFFEHALRGQLDHVLVNMLVAKIVRTASTTEADRARPREAAEREYAQLINAVRQNPGPGAAEITDPDRMELYYHLHAIFSLASGTKGKRQLNLIVIEPKAAGYKRLMGDFLFAFGGFMRKSLRQKDFEIGRYVAHKALTECPEAICPVSEGASEPNSGVPTPVEEKDLPTYKDVDEKVKAQVEEYVYDILVAARKEAGTAFGLFFLFGHWRLAKHNIKKRIRKMLNKAE